MIYARLLLTLALPVVFGFSLVTILFKDDRETGIVERLALAWGIGLGIQGLIMFSMSLLGVQLNLWTAALPVAVSTTLLVVYILNRRLPLVGFSMPKPLSFTEIIHVVLLALVTLYVFFDALVKPIVNFDDLWRQGAIAKIIFTTGKVVTEQSVELAGAHPYLNPLTQAWIYMGIGSWNDALGKVVFALCYLSLLLIFYAGLKRYVSRINALLFTYLLTSFPLIIYHAGTAYSDLMQTFYYSAGAIYLYLWLDKENKAHLIAAALLLGIGNFVKQSGIPLWGIAALVMFLFIFLEKRSAVKSGFSFILISAAISAPWLFFQNSFLVRELAGLGGKIAGLFGAAAVTGGEFVSPALPYGEPTLAGIFYHLGRRMFTYADWQILWFALIIAVLFAWQKIFSAKLKYLLLLIILNLGMVVYAFMGHGYQYLVDGTLVNRVMMYQAPLVLFFVSVIFSELLTVPAGSHGKPAKSAGRRPGRGKS